MKKYDKLTNEQEAENFMQQMLEIPFVQSIRKICFVGKDRTSKDFIIHTDSWIEWNTKYKNILLPFGTELVALINANISDKQIQQCIDDFLSAKK